jgi:hypothetical protein
MPINLTPTSGVTAAQMVALVKAAMAANPLGVSEITIDGQTARYDWKGTQELLRDWERRAAQEAGTRPRAASIKLDGF